MRHAARSHRHGTHGYPHLKPPDSRQQGWATCIVPHRTPATTCRQAISQAHCHHVADSRHERDAPRRQNMKPCHWRHREDKHAHREGTTTQTFRSPTSEASHQLCSGRSLPPSDMQTSQFAMLGVALSHASCARHASSMDMSPLPMTYCVTSAWKCLELWSSIRTRTR